MEPFLALILAGGTAAYAFAQRGQLHERWTVLTREAAKRLSGQVSPGTRFDAPELRATVDGIRVTVQLSEIHKRPDRGRAVATAEIPTETPLRLYVGWGLAALPEAVRYINELPYPKAFGLSGRLFVRAEDRAVADRFGERIVTDLVDLKRTAGAHALEILIRGGSIQISVHGIRPSAAFVERMARVTVRAAIAALEALGQQAPSLPRGDDPMRFQTEEAATVREAPFEPASCELCRVDRSPRERWVACARCGARYHQRCFEQAAGCLVPGCVETESRPV